MSDSRRRETSAVTITVAIIICPWAKLMMRVT